MNDPRRAPSSPKSPTPQHLIPITEPAIGKVAWQERHDPDLRQLVEGTNRSLVLLGRSAKSPRDAARDAHQAAGALAAVAGLDATGVLPSEQRMVDLMHSRGHDLVSGASGTRRGRFLLVDLRGSGITLCLSIGVPTAYGTTHADVLANYVRTAVPRPTGVFATRTDRYSRSWQGLTRLYSELVHLDRTAGAWAGDGGASWRLDDPCMLPMLQVIVETRALETHAMTERRKARRRTRGRSSTPGA